MEQPPLPTLANPIRDSLILKSRAQGNVTRIAAQNAGCSKATADRVLAKHRDWLEETQRLMAETFLSQPEALASAIRDTALDPTNKNQVSAFKEASEKLLGWGLRRGGDIHGDVNIGSMHVGDQTQQLIVGDVDELKRRLIEEREELGL